MAEQDDERRVEGKRDQRIRDSDHEETNDLARRQCATNGGEGAMGLGVGRGAVREEGGFMAGSHYSHSNRDFFTVELRDSRSQPRRPTPHPSLQHAIDGNPGPSCDADAGQAVAIMFWVTAAKLWSSRRRASSTSDFAMFIAGDMRRTLLYMPPLPMSRPRSRAASSRSLAMAGVGSLVFGSVTSSIACIMPMPRTSPMTGYFFWSSSRPSWR